MNEMIWERLAKRFLKCPFDNQLFDSSKDLRLHLCEYHAERICRRHRVSRQDALKNIEMPEKLFLCGHCSDFAVPESGNAQSEMRRHIHAAHPNPFGAVQLTFSVSTDSTLIERFVEGQISLEVCACKYSDCPQVFSDEPSVALHWAGDHCSAPTAEESRHAFDADPDRSRVSLRGRALPAAGGARPQVRAHARPQLSGGGHRRG